MTENIGLLILGILLLPLGIMNCKGNISSIHWYNRTRITEETRPKYGKLMGIGTLIIAIGIILTAILEIILETELVYIIVGAACVVGLLIMLYAQIKYNKGIF